MKKFFKDNENKICFALFVITMIVATIPLMSRYCINGHDLEYHLLRIESLKEGILIGKPFLKVNTLFFGGAGYASSMFYGDLFMYIPALLRVLGLSIGASYHIFVVIIFVLCYASTFYCTYRMTSSKYVATLAAILLTLCPYHMDDMLVRAACGEYTAFIFIPFVVYGIYNVIYENMDRPWIFGIGFAGLILTHPATLLLNVMFGAIVFIVFFAVDYIKYIRNHSGKPKLTLKLAIRLISVTAITLAVTAFMWLPMLEQMLSTTFYVSTDHVDMLDAALAMTDVFTQTFPGVGVLLITLAIGRVFVSSKYNKLVKYADIMLIGGLVYAVGASNIVPWNRLGNIIGFVQFPWRLFVMTSVLLAIADAIILGVIVTEKIKGHYEIVLFIVMALCTMLAMQHSQENATGYYDYGNDYYSYKPYTANVIGGEWLPVTVTDRDSLVALSEHAFSNNGSEIDFTRQNAVITADVPAGCEYVDIPFIYYKGYQAIISSNDVISKLVVTGEGIDGMCRVYTEGREGSIRVQYKSTTAQLISYVISVLSILILIVCYIFKRKNISFPIKIHIEKQNKSSVAGIVVMLLVMAGVSSTLTACSQEDIDYAASQLEQINDYISDDYKDPNSIVDYLKEQSGLVEEEVEEEEPVVYITYNVSALGYEPGGENYSIKVDTQSDYPEYTLASCDEAKANGAVIITKPNLYGNAAAEYIDNMNDIYSKPSGYDAEDIKNIIINDADGLLYLEYYNESSHSENVAQLADKLTSIICSYYENAATETDRAMLYNAAAVLAKAVVVLDSENADEWREKSLELWETVEAEYDNESEWNANRVWAAAELYRMTKQRQYRDLVETVSQEQNLYGISFDNPGYYGVFAYLSSNDYTDYNISGKMMDYFFKDINHKIKEKKRGLLETSLDPDNMIDGVPSDDFINRMIDDCKLSLMANYISISVEYTAFAKTRITYLTGANITGIDYIDKDNMTQYEPMLFVYCGLSE